MANTVPVQLSATVKDAFGQETSTRAYALVNPLTTLAVLEDIWHTWAGDLDQVTDGKITGGRILLPQPFDIFSGKANAVAGSRLEQAALFGYAVAGTDRRYSQVVPAIRNTALIGDRIDLTDADILVWITLWNNDLADLIYANDHEQPISAFLDAQLAFRRLRKQLQRSSKE